MMTDIPFGIAEIDGEAVTIAELDFAEVAAFTSFIPNHEILFGLIRSLDFSGHVPPIVTHDENEAAFLQKSIDESYLPTENDIDLASSVFSRWVVSVAPIGLQSLVERGLVIPAEDGNFKTHRSLDSILRVLHAPVEHISYRTTQVPVSDSASSPVLRSSLYAVQSLSGDWLIAEHFQSHEHIRFICVPSGGKLAGQVDSLVSNGVIQSITDTLVSETGTEYRPFGVLITRTNEHGANVIASAQLADFDGEAKWYSPYEPENDSLVGKSHRKFGNLFTTDTEVAQMAGAPYTQLDIRNGLEGWSLVGDNKDFGAAVERLTHTVLHSQSDHLPDTIPEFFFNEDKET